MKNLFKIGALSLALIAAVFMLNTNAQGTDSGDVQLTIGSQTGYCQYGRELNFGLTGFSADARAWTASFLTNVATGGTGGASSGDASRYCYDSEGDDARYMDIISDDLLNDNNASLMVTSGEVVIDTEITKLYSGSCTVDSGTNGTPAVLNTGVVLFGKSAASGEVCAIGFDSTNLAVYLDANQAVGHYSGTLTLTIPYFDNISN